MSKIRSKEEQRKWCRQQMRDHPAESLEWWAANACLMQDERNQNLYKLVAMSKKHDNLKEESEQEITQLKAKLFDMQQLLIGLGYRDKL